MILLEVEDYCQSCTDFTPYVIAPRKLDLPDGEIILGDTIVRCEYRKRCANIKRFLERQAKVGTEGSNERC